MEYRRRGLSKPVGAAVIGHGHRYYWMVQDTYSGTED
jgi:hypothetical protein